MVSIRVGPAFDADVIVVGGGPAGAAFATRLASARRRVLLVDCETFPRDKVCGDFLGPAALVELEALGVTGRREYRDTNVIQRAGIFLDGREVICRSLPEIPTLPSYGRCIPRLQIDDWVLDTARQAGAHIVEGTRVVSLDVDADGVTVGTESRSGRRHFRARLAVGADGSNSIVARILRGVSPSARDRVVAVRSYFVGDAGSADRGDLYFDARSFPGYSWVFPIGGGVANVGLGMLRETLPREPQRLREALVELVHTDEALRRRLRRARPIGKIVGWPLTTYNPRLPVAADSVILVGDAAGYINPLNGEGIQYALLSARWAAETALECFVENDFSGARLGTYARRVEDEIRYDMALAGLIVQLIRNRDLNGVWIEALRVITGRARANRAYAEITGGILAGVARARDALSLCVLGGTVDHAVYRAALGAVWSLLRGPQYLARQGVNQARASWTLARSAAQQPGAYLDWVSGVIEQCAELLGEAAIDVLARALPSASDAPTHREFVQLQVPLDHVEDDVA